MDSYLSLTGHWINDNWERTEGCLHAQPFDDSHTGENIGNVVMRCLENWNITTKLHLVLRDNARNVIAGLRDAEIKKSIGCMAHTLQLVINELWHKKVFKTYYQDAAKL